jgi:hypothetical protein
MHCYHTFKPAMLLHNDEYITMSMSMSMCYTYRMCSTHSSKDEKE